MGGKKKFPFYLSPEKKAILERRYQEDGSQSLTAFIEKAVDFYLDYLSANDAGQSLSGRRWNRTWWLVSWPMPISSATRICAVGGRRVYKM